MNEYQLTELANSIKDLTYLKFFQALQQYYMVEGWQKRHEGGFDFAAFLQQQDTTDPMINLTVEHVIEELSGSIALIDPEFVVILRETDTRYLMSLSDDQLKWALVIAYLYLGDDDFQRCLSLI